MPAKWNSVVNIHISKDKGAKVMYREK
jgi:hypothetical protein